MNESFDHANVVTICMTVTYSVTFIGLFFCFWKAASSNAHMPDEKIEPKLYQVGPHSGYGPVDYGVKRPTPEMEEAMLRKMASKMNRSLYDKFYKD